MSITTDWVINESKDGLKKESWQFIYAPNSYRLCLSAYYLFERPNADSEFAIRRYWIYNDNWTQRDRELTAMRLVAVERNIVPMPSGIFSLAQESVLRHLKIDKLNLPPAAKEIAVSEFKKHIRYSTNNAALRY